VALGFVFTWIIARYYGADANGVFSLSITLFMILTILSRSGFDMSLTRIFSESQANKQLGQAKKIFGKTLILSVPSSVALSIIFYFSAPYLAETIFNNQNLIPSFRYMSMAIPSWTIIMICAGALRGLGHSTAFTFYFNVGRFLFATSFLAIITFLYTNDNPWLPSACYASACLVLACIAVGHIYTKIKGAEFQSQSMGFKKLFMFSAPMLLSTSMLFIMGWFDRIVLGIFSTDVEVGIYHVTMKLSTLTNFPLTAVNAVVASKFAALYAQGHMEQFRRVVKNSSMVIFLSSLPIIGILIIIPEFILSIFGTQFKSAVSVLFILLAGQFVSVLTGSVGTILQMTGYQRVFQNVLFLGASMNILGNFILCPLYGMTGVAIASFLSIAFWNLASFLMVWKLTGVMSIYNPLTHLYK